MIKWLMRLCAIVWPIVSKLFSRRPIEEAEAKAMLEGHLTPGALFRYLCASLFFIFSFLFILSLFFPSIFALPDLSLFEKLWNLGGF